MPDVIWSAQDLRDSTQALRVAFSGEPLPRPAPARAEVVDPETGAIYASMSALGGAERLHVFKVGSIFPRELGDRLPTVHALVAAFCARTGRLQAVLDGAAVTELKCAAVTALVTDRCAAPGSRILAVIGAGRQARQQVAAVAAVRDLRELRFFARDPQARRAFADDVRAMLPDTTRVIASASIDDAIRGADVVSTATTSHTPLASFADLVPHVHVNCMGGHDVDSRELPQELLHRARLVVEDVDTAVREAGSVHRDAIDLRRLLAIDAALLQATATVFSSTGHASLDLVVTHWLLTSGRARDATLIQEIR